MTKIFVTRPIPDQGIKMLKKKKGIVLDVYEKDQIIPRRELLKRVRGVDVILSILTDKIDAELMDAAGSSLKMVANFAVGFDNIDFKAAAKRRIVVANTPSAEVSETVAEHAIALIFGLAHRLIETDTFTRRGKYSGWGPMMFLGTDVMNKTLGIIGCGRIGTALARRMHDGFGVKIIYFDLGKNQEMEEKFGAKRKSLKELLKQSDFVSLHVPLLPSTRHLISNYELKQMKKTAFIINTSRGAVIDEKALEIALSNHEIAGAGLDVYEFEPKISRKLRALPNVIITPHTASATWEARQAMSKTAAENILDFLSGKKPRNQVKD